MESLLTAVADCLAHQSLQVAVVFVLVAAACYALRKASAHWRYLLWLIVLAKCLTPGLLSVPLAVWPHPTEVRSAPAALPLPAATPRPNEMQLPTAAVPDEREEARATALRVAVAAEIAPHEVVGTPKDTATNASSVRDNSLRAWLATAWCAGLATFVCYVSLKASSTHRRLRQTRRAADPQAAAQFATVEALAFSPDGSTLAVGSHDNKTRLFDIRGDSPRALRVLAHNASVKGLQFDPKGATLAVATGAVELWAVNGNSPSAERKAPLRQSYLNSPDMVFSPDGAVLYYVDGAAVWRWEVAHDFHEAGGKAAPAVGAAQSFSVVPKSNEILYVSKRDGDTVISVGSLAALAATSKPLAETSSGQENDITTSLDGRRFVFSAYHHSRYPLELWERSHDGARKLDVADLGNGYPGSFWCTAFSPDGNTLASGHRDGAIRLWDVSRGRIVLRETGDRVHWGGVGGLDYSPDGKTLASVDWGGWVNLWDVSGKQISNKARLGQHEARAYKVRFSPDGKLLASGDNDGAIKLWSLGNEPTKVESLASHTAGITSLTFSSDGKALLSSGWDGRVIIWDVTQKKISQEWRFPGGVYQAAFGPTGRQVISANGNGSVYVWNTD